MPNQALIDHNRVQFKKSIVQLCPNVWTAVGFAASTQHMIEGDKTLTIVDTSECTKAAENVLAEFRKISSKPIERIIYTHSHRDHISGATIFAEGQDIPIIASGRFKSNLVRQDPNKIAPHQALNRRTLAQFGFGLTLDERISLGAGPGDRPHEGMGAGFIPPTEIIPTDQDIDLDGIKAQLIMAPGETDDHMAVWLPDHKVLLPGDNWYHAFPNLYAIRGTAYRDFQAWADSLEQLAGLNAEVLAAGHTQPVFGAKKVKQVLMTTRAAILHVMQHAANGMNAGLSHDDIAATIALPEDLKYLPWLQEYYGKASWSAKAFAVGTLGWYDGNPTNLGAMTSHKRAQHMTDIAGGAAALRQSCLNTDDLQWKLELCDHLTQLGEDMRATKAETLLQLADDEINATARNTYIWEAKRLQKEREER